MAHSRESPHLPWIAFALGDIMPSDEDHLSLQPIDSCVVQSQQRTTQDRIQRAAVQLELERIRADADTCDESKLIAIGRRFGIRHIIAGTALSAFVLAMFKAWGRTGGLVGLPVAMLIGAWWLVCEREQNHSREISHRLREFKRKHPDTR